MVSSIYRASPVDPLLRSVSRSSIGEGREPDRYTHIIPPKFDSRVPSPLPPAALFGRDISRPSSTSTSGSHTYFFNQPQYHNRSASLSVGRIEHLQAHHDGRPALPGLAALASLAGSQTRYGGWEIFTRTSSDCVEDRSRVMRYLRSA